MERLDRLSKAISGFCLATSGSIVTVASSLLDNQSVSVKLFFVISSFLLTHAVFRWGMAELTARCISIRKLWLGKHWTDGWWREIMRDDHNRVVAISIVYIDSSDMNMAVSGDNYRISHSKMVERIGAFRTHVVRSTWPTFHYLSDDELDKPFQLATRGRGHMTFAPGPNYPTTYAGNFSLDLDTYYGEAGRTIYVEGSRLEDPDLLRRIHNHETRADVISEWLRGLSAGCSVTQPSLPFERSAAG